MKRKTLSLLTVLTASLFLAACDDRSDDLKAISKFKDLTPPRFSDVVNRKDDVREEWSQIALSGPTLQVLRTLIAKNLGADKINRAFTPTGALHHQQFLPLIDQRINGFPLAISKFGCGVCQGCL